MMQKSTVIIISFLIKPGHTCLSMLFYLLAIGMGHLYPLQTQELLQLLPLYTPLYGTLPDISKGVYSYDFSA